jgi:hypothetical protein
MKYFGLGFNVDNNLTSTVPYYERVAVLSNRKRVIMLTNFLHFSNTS